MLTVLEADVRYLVVAGVDADELARYGDADTSLLISVYRDAFSGRKHVVVDEAAIEDYLAVPTESAANLLDFRWVMDYNFFQPVPFEDVQDAGPLPPGRTWLAETVRGAMAAKDAYVTPARQLQQLEQQLLEALAMPPAAQEAAAAATTVAPPAAVPEAIQPTLLSLLSWTYWRSQFTWLWFKQFVAGGIAGGVSRTVTSPLERIKIIFQIQGPEPAHYHGVRATFVKIWREEGWRGYFRGNGTNVMRIVPYSAVQFAAYEQYKRMLLEPGKTELSTWRRLAAGALAGITSVGFTYPLDIVRTRLSVLSADIGSAKHEVDSVTGKPVRKQLPGIWQTGRMMYQAEGGWRALYRGLGPTMTGVAPYVALNFQTYEVLRKYFTKPGEAGPTHTNKLICGALAGTISQTCTYPLDVLRRRMQVTGMKEVGYKYRNTWHAVREVLRQEGLRGMYKGMLPNYLKVAPAIGTSFVTYEWAKNLLGD